MVTVSAARWWSLKVRKLNRAKAPPQLRHADRHLRRCRERAASRIPPFALRQVGVPAHDSQRCGRTSGAVLPEVRRSANVLDRALRHRRALIGTILGGWEETSVGADHWGEHWDTVFETNPFSVRV